VADPRSVKAVAYLEAQHALAISLKVPHMQSEEALTWVSLSPFTSVAKALLLVLTKLLDRMVTRIGVPE
jgi:hypothetical protein